MSIKSTQHVTRDVAIERILDVVKYAVDKDYRQLDSMCFEGHYNLSEFVNEFTVPANIEHINKWTDRMLSDLLDQPFYRWSMFDNYLIP